MNTIEIAGLAVFMIYLIGAIIYNIISIINHKNNKHMTRGFF